MDVKGGGTRKIPYEIKILACLRRLSRGEVWDTIAELCHDLVTPECLEQFFSRFLIVMRERYEEKMIHSPRTDDELQSVLLRSMRRGYPGCIGFLDGVHVHWDMCPTQWTHLCQGKNEYPTIGWQAAVNHRRRFIHVGPGMFGSVNDMTAVKSDILLKHLRTNPMYKDGRFKIFNEDGSVSEISGLWLSVDGGYIHVPELLVGDRVNLNHYMNFWTSFMESERKHVECAFGILKARFRILKLPIRMHKFEEIDDMFVVCCILHNMCLDVDGGDEGWNLGESIMTGNYGPSGLTYGGYEGGEDGRFSDDENHTHYQCGNLYFDITPDIDYTVTGLVYPTPGTQQDKADFITKRDKIAKNWFYMYNKRMIDF